MGNLLADSSGNLFGTTYYGPDTNGNYYGTVFEVKRGSGIVTTLASFNNTDGANPDGGLVFGNNGFLFGTTERGGPYYYGTVFAEYEGGIGTVVAFNGPNGTFPHGSLLKDSAGDLFGTTWGGGASDNGTVFEIKALSGTVTTLTSFDGTNGSFPEAGLVQDSNGNFFGTTTEGGPYGEFGWGTLFELSNGSSTITPLASLKAPPVMPWLRRRRPAPFLLDFRRGRTWHHQIECEGASDEA
jgi:uncharacterized repeat protein (TIGR03803 family)